MTKARASVAEVTSTDIPLELAVLETRSALESSGSNIVWRSNFEARATASDTMGLRRKK